MQDHHLKPTVQIQTFYSSIRRISD